MNAKGKIPSYVSQKAITMKWQDKEPPWKGERIAIVKEMYEMEKQTFSLRLYQYIFSMYFSIFLQVLVKMFITYEHEYYIERKYLVL